MANALKSSSKQLGMKSAPNPKTSKQRTATPVSETGDPRLDRALAQVQAQTGGGGFSTDNPMILVRATGTSKGKSTKRSYTQLQTDFKKISNNPTKIRQWQERLWRAGYFGDMAYDKITWGVMDRNTLAAYNAALDHASDMDGSNKTFNQIIDEEGAAREASGLNADMMAGGGRAPFAAALTNPADIQSGLQGAGKELLGRNLNDPRFTAAFQSGDLASQRARYNAQESGGVITDAPSLDTAAEQWIREHYAGEFGAHEMANQGAEFFSMLDGVV